MNSISIEQFKNNLQNFIQQAIDQHTPLKIADREVGDCVIALRRRLGTATGNITRVTK
jgi:PHD/YefM family antitoxin component YafN of YafNO toxin-antitoxin module